MALTGPKPREDRSQVRFKGHTAEWTEVENRPFAGAPELPPRNTGVDLEQAEERRDGEGIYCPFPWPENTLRWYRTMSRMPHAILWDESDWEFVFETAEVHARFTEGWKGTAVSELRQRVKTMGGNMDARRDLRIRYVVPTSAGRSKPTADGTVVDMNSYRDL
jgi:hypothetical protein